MPRNYISIADAAQMFGVTPRTVRRWISSGHLTVYRVGPTPVRLHADEVVASLPQRIPTAGLPA